jgi:RNA polymerase sigma-32 factor
MAYADGANSWKGDRKLIKQAMAAPMLEAEHELSLARAWRERQDTKALNALTSSYLRLVIAVAARFRHYGLPFPDLIQEGSIGLMQAAQRFEPEREVRFSTYATWWIRASIQDYVLRNWSIVRLTSTAAQKSLFFNLRRLRAMIDERPGQNMSREAAIKISQKLKVSVRDVEDMDGRLSAGDRSLNGHPTEDSDSEWQDLLVDTAPLPDEQVMTAHDSRVRSAWIRSALETLSPRELAIIQQRRLQDDEDCVTLEALGQKLGISKERVRQIEASALNKLKRALTGQAGAVWDSALA